MSPFSRWGARSAMVSSTAAAGTISQSLRGFSSLPTRSASEDAATALSRARSATAFGDRSNTTHWWPPLMSRRIMFEPIRPNPIIAICMSSFSVPEPAIPADQVVGRAVVAELGLGLALELGDDALGQHLAELDAPLIERVDVPDRPLREHAVLVERDQLAQRRRGQAIQENRVGRSVALEDAVRHEPLGRALGRDLVSRLAAGERLGLREHVGEQHVVMPADPVERLCERNEIARDQPRALVEQLVERVLPVRSRLAPVDRAGLLGHRLAGERHMLSVALHRQLLEIGREALEILVVG